MRSETRLYRGGGSDRGVVLAAVHSISLATERPEAFENAHRHSLSCMALVDPTVTPYAANDAPVFQGVDFQTTALLQRVAPKAAPFFRSHWSAQVTALDGPTYCRTWRSLDASARASPAANSSSARAMVG